MALPAPLDCCPQPGPPGRALPFHWGSYSQPWNPPFKHETGAQGEMDKAEGDLRWAARSSLERPHGMPRGSQGLAAGHGRGAPEAQPVRGKGVWVGTGPGESEAAACGDRRPPTWPRELLRPAVWGHPFDASRCLRSLEFLREVTSASLRSVPAVACGKLGLVWEGTCVRTWERWLSLCLPSWGLGVTACPTRPSPCRARRPPEAQLPWLCHLLLPSGHRCPSQGQLPFAPQLVTSDA